MHSLEAPAPSTFSSETPVSEIVPTTPETQQTNTEFVTAQFERVREAMALLNGEKPGEYSFATLEAAKGFMLGVGAAGLAARNEDFRLETRPATAENTVGPHDALTALYQQLAANRAFAEQQQHNRHMLAEQRRHNQAVEASLVTQKPEVVIETLPGPTMEYVEPPINDTSEHEYTEADYYSERAATAKARKAARQAERRDERSEARSEIYDKAKSRAKQFGRAALRRFGRFAKRAGQVVAAGVSAVRSRSA